MANLPSPGLRNRKSRLLANRLVGIPHQTDTHAKIAGFQGMVRIQQLQILGPIGGFAVTPVAPVLWKVS